MLRYFHVSVRCLNETIVFFTALIGMHISKKEPNHIPLCSYLKWACILFTLEALFITVYKANYNNCTCEWNVNNVVSEWLLNLSANIKSHTFLVLNYFFHCVLSASNTSEDGTFCGEGEENTIFYFWRQAFYLKPKVGRTHDKSFQRLKYEIAYILKETE